MSALRIIPSPAIGISCWNTKACWLTWQLNKLPVAWTQLLDLKPTAEGDCVAAIQLDDHRLAYLDYEGPISSDRGSVSRVDRGPFHFVERTEHHLRVYLLGTQMTGEVSLTKQVEGWTLSLECTGD